MIIPFFIPHSGCPHQCVFCNQKSITGQTRPTTPESIPQKISEHLKTNVTQEPVQVAFYGGSFTALSNEEQKSYLAAVQPFIQSGSIQNIRLSTRPDCLNREILTILKKYHVQAVELGAQSLNDNVLALSGRGHTAADTAIAVKLLKEYGFVIGLQLMAGLPGDSADFFMKTIHNVIELKPDFVRLYPLLVISGTPLEKLYASRTYTPLSLDDAVLLCRNALVKFENAGIEVIRIGLQPTEELDRPGTILAGPYHPAFRQLVESSLMLDKMRSTLAKRTDKRDPAVFIVNPSDVSTAIGQRRVNIESLKKEFGLSEVRIVVDQDIPRKSGPILLSTFQGGKHLIGRNETV